MKPESREIFSHLKGVASEQRQITYSELADRIGRKSVTADSMRIYLAEIAKFCKENKAPIITSVVVRKDTLTPGIGFYEIAGKKTEDLEFWLKEMKKSFDYDWTTLTVEK